MKFLFSATNQHGVHSPFVYGFVTKSLYKKGDSNGSHTEQILTKSIAYFSIKKIKLILESDELTVKLNSLFTGLEYGSSPYDLIYIEHPEELFKNLDPNHLHNDTVLVLNNIYKSKSNTEKWTALKELEQVRVTIDLYHCGMAFFRQEQAKEHFKIRI